MYMKRALHADPLARLIYQTNRSFVLENCKVPSVHNINLVKSRPPSNSAGPPDAIS